MAEFPLFSQLPKELRDMIWEYAYPDDVRETCFFAEGYASAWACNKRQPTVITRLPACAHVSREARKLALKHITFDQAPNNRLKVDVYTHPFCRIPTRPFRPDLDAMRVGDGDAASFTKYFSNIQDPSTRPRHITCSGGLALKLFYVTVHRTRRAPLLQSHNHGHGVAHTALTPSGSAADQAKLLMDLSSITLVMDAHEASTYYAWAGREAVEGIPHQCVRVACCDGKTGESEIAYLRDVLPRPLSSMGYTAQALEWQFHTQQATLPPKIRMARKHILNGWSTDWYGIRLT